MILLLLPQVGVDVWFLSSRERSCFASCSWSGVEPWNLRVAVQRGDRGPVPGTVLPVKPHPLRGLAGCSQCCCNLPVVLIWRGLGVCAHHRLDFYHSGHRCGARSLPVPQGKVLRGRLRATVMGQMRGWVLGQSAPAAGGLRCGGFSGLVFLLRRPKGQLSACMGLRVPRCCSGLLLLFIYPGSCLGFSLSLSQGEGRTKLGGMRRMELSSMSAPC